MTAKLNIHRHIKTKLNEKKYISIENYSSIFKEIKK
jgi:hypothetical protein